MRLAITGVTLALCAFLFYAFGQASAPEHEARRMAAGAIDLCRKEQDDALKDISTRRFIRDACDTMTRDYVTKYGRQP